MSHRLIFLLHLWLYFSNRNTKLLPVRHARKGLGRGYLFVATLPAHLIGSAIRRVVAFVDGQNLYRSVKESFGYHYPNYDLQKLSEAVCKSRGWNLIQVRFYTGVPDATDDPRWNHFWVGKLAVMGKSGIEVFSRPLRYRNDSVVLPDGSRHTFLRGSEKGIDVRIALDVIRLAIRNAYDMALVFSQDQDLSEVADEIRVISTLLGRWIHMACAFPVSPTTRNHRRGINHSDWIQVDRKMYDACIDPTDYR